MLAPSITANVLLGIVNALQSYQLTYVLTGPNNKSTQVLSLLVYVQGFGKDNMGYASAMSFALFVILLVFSLVQVRLQGRSQRS